LFVLPSFKIFSFVSSYEIQKKFGSLKKLGYRGKNSAPPPPPSPSPSTMSQVSGSVSSLNTAEGSSDASSASAAPPPSAPHSLDRKYLRFLSSNKSQNVPVPTAQFRSYRRVVAPDTSCSTLPASTKIVSGAAGQGGGGAAQGPTLAPGLAPGFTPNTGAYEQHRLPSERAQGIDQQASLRGRPFLHQSVESVLANFEEVEGR